MKTFRSWWNPPYEGSQNGVHPKPMTNAGALVGCLICLLGAVLVVGVCVYVSQLLLK